VEEEGRGEAEHELNVWESDSETGDNGHDRGGGWSCKKSIIAKKTLVYTHTINIPSRLPHFHRCKDTLTDVSDIQTPLALLWHSVCRRDRDQVSHVHLPHPAIHCKD
jgi:hypothetical protein